MDKQNGQRERRGMRRQGEKPRKMSFDYLSQLCWVDWSVGVGRGVEVGVVISVEVGVGVGAGGVAIATQHETLSWWRSLETKS